MAQTTGIVAVAATSFALSWMTYYGSRTFSNALSKVYRGMAADEKAAWDTRVVSTVHAMVLFGGAVWTLGAVATAAAEAGYEATFVSGAHTLMQVFMAISIGYFLQDALVIVSVRGALWSPADLVHHAVAVAVLLVCLTTQTFLVYTMWAMLGEASTPLLNLRYIFGKLGLVVPVVDYLFIAAFFTSRPVNMILNLGHAIAHYHRWSHSTVAHFQLGLGIVFAALQFYWAYLVALAIRDSIRPKAGAVPAVQSPPKAPTALKQA